MNTAKTMSRSLRTIFLSGLAIVLPAALTIYLILWLLVTADRLMAQAVAPLLGGAGLWPGVGIALALALVMLVGILMQVWGFRSLLKLGQKLMERLPLVKVVYGPLRDLVDLFNPESDSGRGTPVAVRVGEQGEVIGFVTSDDPPFPRAHDESDIVAVYLPMSYQLGGYTLFVPKERLRNLDMSADEAMKLTLTAGVSKRKNAPGSDSEPAGQGKSPPS